MSRKQMIMVTCEYRKPNQDLAYSLPECFPLRSPPGILPGIPQEYMVHGVPKRLHCRPRISVTPSKVGESEFCLGKYPTMFNGIPNVLKMYGSKDLNTDWSQLKMYGSKDLNTDWSQLKMYGSKDLNTDWSQLKMKLPCSPDKHETNLQLDTAAGESYPLYMSGTAIVGESRPVNISEATKMDNCTLQSEIGQEDVETNGGENLIRENNSREHLEEETLRDPATDACSECESRDEVSLKNITPPNSPNPDQESSELQITEKVEYSQEPNHSTNEIHVIDESAIYNELGISDREPATWYHKLVELELHNIPLQVPKPEHNVKTQLPNLCKFQLPSPHFPPDETSESRRISRTERHVQYLLLKENSVKTREKFKQNAQKLWKPAV